MLFPLLRTQRSMPNKRVTIPHRSHLSVIFNDFLPESHKTIAFLKLIFLIELLEKRIVLNFLENRLLMFFLIFLIFLFAHRDSDVHNFYFDEKNEVKR
jgi:hypothetical protein